MKAMPSIVIERLARALYRRETGDEWIRAATRCQNEYREKARLVLATIREPTDAMQRAGLAAAPRTASNFWRAMVDEAAREDFTE
jgi:hypothetical protein